VSIKVPNFCAMIIRVNSIACKIRVGECVKNLQFSLWFDFEERIDCKELLELVT
jgi:hypothetical protein